MSLVTTIAKIIGSIIFGLFLIALIFVSAMVQFTEYSNLQPAFSGLVSQGMQAPSDAEFAQMKTTFMQYCQQSGMTSVNPSQTGGGPNVTIQCADINSAASGQEFIQLIAASLFNDIYYKNYTCDFVSCFLQLPQGEPPLVLLSAHANAFFKSPVMWAIAGIIAGLALIVFAIRKPFGIAKAVGIEMLVSGAVAYVGINAIKGMVPAVLAGAADALNQLLNGLFATLQNNFIIVLAIGVVLTVIGFVGVRFVKTKKPAKKKK